MLDYLICIRTSQSQVNNNMPLRSVNLVIECIDYLIGVNLKYSLEGRNSLALYDNAVQFQTFSDFAVGKIGAF